MSTGIDYADLVRQVVADEHAMDLFRAYWRETSGRIFDERERREREVRTSDAGRCTLNLSIELAGFYDIPDDYESYESRMQLGILDGAKASCLIAAGIQRWHWPFTTQIEPEVEFGGIRGHADCIVCAEPQPIELVECKLTFYTKGIEPPDVPNARGEDHKYWIYQACHYALAVNAETFCVLVHAPAAWNGPKRKSFRYITDDWRDETIAEFARLQRATGPDAPADPREAWRCVSCRFSQCERNANPLRPTVERIVDELGALS
jgi:hypothetical protein